MEGETAAEDEDEDTAISTREAEEADEGSVVRVTVEVAGRSALSTRMATWLVGEMEPWESTEATVRKPRVCCDWESTATTRGAAEEEEEELQGGFRRTEARTVCCCC